MDNKSIIVDLDSLIDTRLALVYLLSKTTAEQIIKDGSYYKRTKDNFGLISNDIFKCFYRHRNKLLLTLGLPTHIFKVLKEAYGDTVTDEINHEYEGDITIYVNTYPYTLNSIEMENIVNVVKKEVPQAKVEITTMSMQQLTPLWVDKNVDTMILYDGIEWVEYHTANNKLINTPLIHTMLISPALINGIMPVKDISREVFIEVMRISNSLIDLVLMDSINFSRRK